MTRKKTKPAPPKKPPAAPPPFDVSLVKRLTPGGSDDPVEIIKALAALGLAIPTAAALVDMAPDDFADLLKNTELGRAWKQSAALVDALVSQALLNKAKAGHVGACQFWLTKQLPEVFDAGKSSGKPAEPPAEPASPLSDLKLKVVG
jgi:hypothetical protein